MDVNGYIFHINNAIKNMANAQNITNTKQIYNLDYVKLSFLQKEFEKYPSWKDLLQGDSEFTLYLLSMCKYEGTSASEEDEDTVLDEQKLKLMGVIWCCGDDNKKAHELFDII